ncbi:MAG: YicC/YloC family endoribonuclease [Gammaproteobacteria bacterium]
MINSMTGFASAAVSTAAGELSWELRSVNHRYLETQFKLPEGFRSLEPALRDITGNKLLRGKLDASLQFRPAAEAAAKIHINKELADQVIAQARAIENEIHTPGPISAIEVLRWPGVVVEESIDLSDLFEPAKQSLDQALDALREARSSEGARIHKLIEDRLGQISVLVAGVRERMPTVLDGIRRKILERAETLNNKIDNDRLEQELVMLAQKMDVAEELDRLDAHVEETRETFSKEGAVGRKLDFLMQEFNREANTLGSKSADTETTKAAVDLKVLIEQMREQIQNVE